MALGDSITAGAFAEARSLPHLLQLLQTTTNVVNL